MHDLWEDFSQGVVVMQITAAFFIGIILGSGLVLLQLWLNNWPRNGLSSNTAWTSCYRCSECKTPVSWSTMMCSSGTCPHCGHTNPGTVIDCDEGATRNVDGKREYKWIGEES